MKFSYEFRTSDNSRHDGIVTASCREAAFSVLRKQGIRPIRLEECPGLFNRIQGFGARWFVVALLSAVAGTAMFLALKGHRSSAVVSSLLDSPIRRQLVGDQLVIEKGIREGWRDVFPEEGERFLASFAVPGVSAAIRSTTEKEIEGALGRHVSPHEDDPIEVRQIKVLVEGLKVELRKYLSDGGTIIEYGQELVKRQELEMRYFNQVKAELERAAKNGTGEGALVKLWERRNEDLRNMGIRLVPLPDSSGK